MTNGSGTRAAGDKPVLLRARGLALDLEGQRVLDGIEFELRAGEWVSLVGPNGAGKSSLLALLAGLVEPLGGSGRIEWLGAALASWPARQRAAQIAWLAQAGSAAGEAEIASRDIVALGRLPRHGLLSSPDANDRAAVQWAMDETESTPFAARRLSSLSGGERQRVLLARALAVQPRLFLFDEPTAHLDAPHQRNLLATFAARARAGAAVLAVMHDLGAALAADRVLVLQAGRLVADGAPADAALREALVGVFGGAFSIERVLVAGRERWVVVPAL